MDAPPPPTHAASTPPATTASMSQAAAAAPPQSQSQGPPQQQQQHPPPPPHPLARPMFMPSSQGSAQQPQPPPQGPPTFHYSPYAPPPQGAMARPPQMQSVIFSSYAPLGPMQPPPMMMPYGYYGPPPSSAQGQPPAQQATAGPQMRPPYYVPAGPAQAPPPGPQFIPASPYPPPTYYPQFAPPYGPGGGIPTYGYPPVPLGPSGGPPQFIPATSAPISSIPPIGGLAGSGPGATRMVDDARRIEKAANILSLVKQDRPIRSRPEQTRRPRPTSSFKVAGTPPPPPNAPPCYCNEEKPATTRPMIQCAKCHKMFHQSCMDSIAKWTQPSLLGDDFFYFMCRDCHGNGTEKIRRLTLSWSDVAHLALFNLSHTVAPFPNAPDGRLYYHMRRHITAFVDANWERLWLKPRPQTWGSSIASAMGTSDRFITGKDAFPNEPPGLWALSNVLSFPSMDEVSRRSRYAAYEISETGELQEMVLKADPMMLLHRPAPGTTAGANGTSSRPSGTKKRKDPPDGSFKSEAKNQVNLETKTESADASPNKKKKPTGTKMRTVLKIPEMRVNPETAIMLYPDIDNPAPPFPVRISVEATHAAPQMKTSEDGMTTYTDKGYRTAKASHGVYEGSWYFEVTFKGDGKGHARIGWSQISGDLQAPVGYDMFSYSFRDSPGTLFHKSCPMPMPEAYSAGFADGDVLGVLIKLPKVTNYLPYIRRLWTGQKYEQLKHNPLQTLADSSITYYKNGESLGVAFSNLNAGKYYPAVSSFNGGHITCNFGPSFRFFEDGRPPEGARACSELSSVFRWMDLKSFLEGRIESSPSLKHVFHPETIAAQNLVVVPVTDAAKFRKKRPPAKRPHFPFASARKKKKKVPKKSSGGGDDGGAAKKDAEGDDGDAEDAGEAEGDGDAAGEAAENGAPDVVKMEDVEHGGNGDGADDDGDEDEVPAHGTLTPEEMLAADILLGTAVTSREGTAPAEPVGGSDDDDEDDDDDDDDNEVAQAAFISIAKRLESRPVPGDYAHSEDFEMEDD